LPSPFSPEILSGFCGTQALDQPQFSAPGYRSQAALIRFSAVRGHYPGGHVRVMSFAAFILPLEDLGVHRSSGEKGGNNKGKAFHGHPV